MQAYYNILTTLKTQLEADAFCNTVSQGDIFDIDLNKQEIFPLAHIIVNETTKEKNILVFNVTVLCMDIVDISKDEATDTFRGNDNEQDVLNTQLAVGLRLVEVLERGGSNNTFMMRGTPTFEPFTERFENNMAGWAVTFDIYVPNTMLACDDLVTTNICASATVANSSESYSATVASGGNLTLPDIDINVNGTDEGDVPSVTDVSVNLTNSSGTVTPNSITVTGGTVDIVLPDAAPLPVGATLMKTGQTTSYATGDDGDLEAGRATDFFTLANNNPFGNTNRFTDELGGTSYANDIVIDWSTYDNIGGTVLGYYRLSMALASWNDQIGACLALSIGTFTTDWRLWNVHECMNILNYNIGNTALNYSPFNNSDPGNFHTSTSRDALIAMKRNGMQVFLDAKTNNSRGIACRTFTVTGTTLT